MKEALGAIALLLALVAYAPYIKDIIRHKTKPHAFSWLTWSVLAGIAFSVQLANNGGPGAWMMAFTACATLLIFLLSLHYGEKNILFVDWVSLCLAGAALLLWIVTDKPLLSIVLISFIDAVGGFFPTFRKVISKPHEETAVIYLIYAVSLGLSVLALSNLSLLNALYPASFVLINLAMGLFIIFRRRTLASQ